mmetsp:Transcript_1944/g.4787  ORF Transcript_1944/g.4787 Transcript_1944/m.4787 type:complete len:1097 (+) Transcript_1944:194-3484(+)
MARVSTRKTRSAKQIKLAAARALKRVADIGAPSACATGGPLDAVNDRDFVKQVMACNDFGGDGEDDADSSASTGYPSNDSMYPMENPALLAEVKAGTEQLALELEDYLASKNPHLMKFGEDHLQKLTLSDQAVADLQLATARKLRELIPSNRDLLYKAQECNWIPLLLSWLNLHDRPAVQVEALLALTNIAELCAQQSYYQHSHAQSTAMASAAQAAAAAVSGSPAASHMQWPDGTNGSGSNTGSASNTTYPYPSIVAPAPGSVPFPPLSFSQTLSAEAVAAFDASLTSTIKNGFMLEGMDKGQGGFTLPPAPLFPPSNQLASGRENSALNPPTGGINFTSLAPPPGGAHNSVPSNSFLPPPTPLSYALGGSPTPFPQQLSASSQHLLLRHTDAIPTLILLLSSPNREVYEQAMWILGSIAVGDSPGNSSTGNNSASSNSQLDRDKSVSARDVILAAGVMNQLLRCLESHPTNLSLQRIGTWTLSNLVEGIFQQGGGGSGKGGSRSTDYSSSDEIDMSILLPVLRRLSRTTDAEVLSYTCWTLSHLCDGPSSHIAAIVITHDVRGTKSGLVPRLVELLLHPSWRVTKPALRTIGNIVCAEGNDESTNCGSTADYTEVILECGAVPRLKELIMHGNREIQKEACWTLSNIAAGTIDQIQSVIDSGAIEPLVALVRAKSTDQEVRSEACWVVLNATSCGSDAQIEVLVDQGCVAVLDVLLADENLVMMALDGLERVLQIEEKREAMRQQQMKNRPNQKDKTPRPPLLVSASMIETARDSHGNSTIVKRADKIWKKHFVTCALCKNSYSKHRVADASFCNECKCHVCHLCDCRLYHLSYQEELWAESEEKTQPKKTSKKNKNKNKKKKEKQKQKKAASKGSASTEASPPQNPSPPAPVSPASKDDQVVSKNQDAAAATSAADREKKTAQQDPLQPAAGSMGAKASSKAAPAASSESASHDTSNATAPAAVAQESSSSPSPSPTPAVMRQNITSNKSKSSDVSGSTAATAAMSAGSEDGATSSKKNPTQQPSIDFVLYLQQTGSIIALAKLMDALDCSEEHESLDGALDDAELQLIQQQQQHQLQQSHHLGNEQAVSQVK